MSRSASKIRDVKSSVQKEYASLKQRRSVSVDTRARGSYVPERKRPSSEERISGNKLPCRQWGSSRKSSLNLLETKRKDIRPLSDKVYQKRKITELVAFLDESGFSPAISASKLTVPSRKDYETIFQFLYNSIDETYKVNRFEEEAPKILKNLCYPFTVNKSALLCITRTNWPTLLGILIWLMDLCKFGSKVDLKCLFETAGEDDSSTIHSILVNYICQCYVRHCESGIDDEDQQNDVFNEIIKTYILKDDFDDLLSAKEEKKQQLESVEKKINEFKSLSDHSILLDKNIEKYEEYIVKMRSHYENKNALCEQLLQELKERETRLQSLQEEVSKKQDAYDAQGFDGKMHLGYFEIQKKELNEKYEKKRMMVKQLQDKLWETEMELKKKNEKANAAAKDFSELSNNMIESLETVLNPLLNIKDPQIQHLCSNFQFNFPGYKNLANDGNLQSNENFQNAWKTIGEKVKSVEEILNRICATYKQKLTEIEMNESEVSMKLKLLSLEENKREQDLNSKKKIAGDEISMFEVQLKKSHDVISSLRDECLELERTNREMVEESKILQEMQKTKEKELKQYLAKQAEMFAFFSKTEKEVLQECQTHGIEIANKVQELKKS